MKAKIAGGMKSYEVRGPFRQRARRALKGTLSTASEDEARRVHSGSLSSKILSVGQVKKYEE